MSSLFQTMPTIQMMVSNIADECCIESSTIVVEKTYRLVLRFLYVDCENI